MITVKELQVRRKNKVICQVPNFRLDENMRCWIHGRNGSGKSTFLRVLAGLESHQQGTWETGLAPRDVVYLCQSPFLFKGGLRHNLGYGLKGRGVPPAERKRLIEEFMDSFDLRALEDQDLDVASGGERQRVALARAMIVQPRLLLLDEPFSELDQNHAERIHGILDHAKCLSTLVTSPLPPERSWEHDVYEMQRPQSS